MPKKSIFSTMMQTFKGTYVTDFPTDKNSHPPKVNTM